MSGPRRVYFDLAREAIASAGIEERLAASRAIVLERIACGAGATNWFVCRTLEKLPAIIAWLHPGSKVSFYFDERIRQRPWTDATRAEVLELIRVRGEIVFGRLARANTAPPDYLVELEMSLPGSADELAEESASLRSHQPVFFGEFPDKDHDGVNAFTIVLPDRDGLVRSHPY